nr:DivIVA domain-containing protein [Kineosporia mesophila]
MLMVLLTLAVVAGVIAVATGVIRGGLDEPAQTVPARALPAEGVTGRDVASLRFVQGFRGYRMDQVDAALDTLAIEVDRLRAQVAQEKSARLQLARGRAGGAVTTTGEGIVPVEMSQTPRDQGATPGTGGPGTGSFEAPGAHAPGTGSLSTTGSQPSGDQPSSGPGTGSLRGSGPETGSFPASDSGTGSWEAPASGPGTGSFPASGPVTGSIPAPGAGAPAGTSDPLTGPGTGPMRRPRRRAAGDAATGEFRPRPEDRS